MVLSEGPITPPESPGSEQMDLEADAGPSALPLQHHASYPLEVSMEQNSSTLQGMQHADYPVTPISQDPETPSEPEEDPIGSVHDVPSITNQPLRSLSQENIDLPSTRSLILRDFEVRGTLGM